MGRKDGFTLVELLIVLAVIAVLAVLLLPRISSFLTKQKANQLATQAMEIERADSSYYKDCGTYPSNSAINALWNKNIASVAGNNMDNISAQNCWNGPYMSALPPNDTSGAQGSFTTPFGSNSSCQLNSNAPDVLGDGANYDITLSCSNIPTNAVSFLKQKMNGNQNTSGMLLTTNCNANSCTVIFVLEEN